MVTRFSAIEARQKAEAAKKSLDEQRKLNIEAKKQLAKEKAFIKNGFDTQRLMLFSAAMNKDVLLSKLPNVFYYKTLLELGFTVVEVGPIEDQPHKRNKLIDNEYLNKVKHEILSLIDLFLNIAVHRHLAYGDGHKTHIRKKEGSPEKTADNGFRWGDPS